MTWHPGHRVYAFCAGLIRRLACQNPDHTASARAKVISDTVPFTSKRRLTDETQLLVLPDLTARAERFYNHSRKGVAEFMGRISDLAPLRDPKAKAALREYRKTKGSCSNG